MDPVPKAPDYPPEIYRRVLDDLYDGVYLVDRDRRITYWNQGAERITGYARHEVVGLRCMDNLLVHVDATGHCLCKGNCPLAATMVDQTAREAEVFLNHKGGHRLPVRVRTAPLTDVDGRVVGGVEVFSDNSSQAAARDQMELLKKLAYVDVLTEVANRRYTEMALTSAVNESTRYGWTFGVVMLDVDHFKAVNDTLGHEAGDLVLKAVAKTLSGACRSFDLVGRWGGEEFLAVIKNVTGAQLGRAAEKFRSLVASSRLALPSGPVGVTLSGGAALWTEGDTPESLVAKADALLYASKNAGRNRISL